MKKEINVWDYAGQIMEDIGKGALLTTCADGKVNTMTIGWGTIGVIWGKPVFQVLVRESRHTKNLLDQTGEFTVNAMMGGDVKNILAVCGTKSGRDMDKIKELGLTLEPGKTVAVPAIRELPLTVECRVIYKQQQDPAAIDPALYQRYYAPDTKNAGDHHTVYYGEITVAYIVE